LVGVTLTHDAPRPLHPGVTLTHDVPRFLFTGVTY
jgi:hypothetical protein